WHPPPGGAGVWWSTSFRTSCASGQNPAIPRRSGWLSRRKVTSRTINNVCINLLYHGILPLGWHRRSLVDELQGLQDGCDRASAKDFHEIRAVFTRGVA